MATVHPAITHMERDPFRKTSLQNLWSLSNFRSTHVAPLPPNPSSADAIPVHQTSKPSSRSRSGPYLAFVLRAFSGRVVVDSSSSTSTVPPPKCGFRQRHSSSHHNHSPPTKSSTNGTSPTAIAIPNGPPMPMAAIAPAPDAGLSALGSALSHVYPASAFASHCLTHPTVAQLGVFSALIGLAQAAAVNSSPIPAEHHDHTCTILIPVLFSCFLLASLITVWWVRHHIATTTHHHSTAHRGTPPPPNAPPPSVSFPSPAHIRSASLPPQTILNLANSLTATPIRPRRREWTNPEILIAAVSVVLSLIGLVIGGVSLLYARLQVSKA